MYSKDESFCEWYVIFTPAKIHHWIFKLLDKDFGHVYAVQDLNDYQWLVIQPRVNIVECKIMLKAHYPHIRLLTGLNDRIVHVKVRPDSKARGGLNWFNCTEQVKALLGIKSFFTFTPKQLHDKLLKGDQDG